MYGESRGAGELNALQYAAVSAGGIHGGVPATAAMLAKHSCLAKLPVLLTIPAASTFADDLAVYACVAAQPQLEPPSHNSALPTYTNARATAGWPRL